jgi:hypothetical protein
MTKATPVSMTSMTRMTLGVSDMPIERFGARLRQEEEAAYEWDKNRGENL